MTTGNNKTSETPRQKTTFIMEDVNQWRERRQNIDDRLSAIKYSKLNKGVPQPRELKSTNLKQHEKVNASSKVPTTFLPEDVFNQALPVYVQSKIVQSSELPDLANAQRLPSQMKNAMSSMETTRNIRIMPIEENVQFNNNLHFQKHEMERPRVTRNHQGPLFGAIAIPRSDPVTSTSSPIVQNGIPIVNCMNQVPVYSYSFHSPYVASQNSLGTYDNNASLGYPKYVRIPGKTSIIIEKDIHGYKCPGCTTKIKYRWELKHHFSKNRSHIRSFPKELLCFEFQNHIYSLYDIDE